MRGFPGAPKRSSIICLCVRQSPIAQSLATGCSPVSTTQRSECRKGRMFLFQAKCCMSDYFSCWLVLNHSSSGPSLGRCHHKIADKTALRFTGTHKSLLHSKPLISSVYQLTSYEVLVFEIANTLQTHKKKRL